MICLFFSTASVFNNQVRDVTVVHIQVWTILSNLKFKYNSLAIKKIFLIVRSKLTNSKSLYLMLLKLKVRKGKSHPKFRDVMHVIFLKKLLWFVFIISEAEARQQFILFTLLVITLTCFQRLHKTWNYHYAHKYKMDFGRSTFCSRNLFMGPFAVSDCVWKFFFDVRRRLCEKYHINHLLATSKSPMEMLTVNRELRMTILLFWKANMEYHTFQWYKYN